MAAKGRGARPRPLRKLLDEGPPATGPIHDQRLPRRCQTPSSARALIATLTRWEDGPRHTRPPNFQQALTDQLVKSVTRA